MEVRLIEKIQEFESSFEDKRIMGLYMVDVDGADYYITRNGNQFKAISHYIDGDRLETVTYKFQEALLRVLE